MNNKTIEYYNANAEAFVSDTEQADMQVCRNRFLRYMKPGARILDAGCGSGRDVLAFQKAGYSVEAFDASEEICRIASERTGIEVRRLRFEDIEGEDEYEGIWACASLLHVQRNDLPDVLSRLCRLLKPEGILYASFKYGSGERETDGKYYIDLTESECRNLLENSGLSIEELFVTEDVRADHQSGQWVNAIARKA